MEDNQWHDPLLITDVSCQQQHNSHCQYPLLPLSRLEVSDMDDPDDSPSKIGGRSILGFSLTSPDLVICAGSPDIPTRDYEYSPDFKKNSVAGAINLSLENGIEGSVPEHTHVTPAGAMGPILEKTSAEDFCPSISFELPPPPVSDEKPKTSVPVLGINAGSWESTVISGGEKFLEDNCFSGGDTMRTDRTIGDGQDDTLYQTARFGDFSYHFKALETGVYMIDLHFAEIVFTEGPLGMRVFDVFIQQQKVISCLDIYAQVGGNTPLVIHKLESLVSGDAGISIRFEGVTGSATVSGISIRKQSPQSSRGVELFKGIGMSQMLESKFPKVDTNDNVDELIQKFQTQYESQKKELVETKIMLEELKKENEFKTRDCQKAWKSLKELQNELMRKSMHVGSLAYAIEGQVKEKSRWFSSMRDLTRKLKIMKMDQIKLSEEALSYKNCVAEVNGLSIMIHSRMKQEVELYEDLKIKFIKGAKERKELYNKILELKGNIRVFCRCRPLNDDEISTGASMTIDFEAAKDGELSIKSNGSCKKTFRFDAVFSPQADQVDVFEDTAPFATSVLDGYNVCIFAYGQTGTGKTFTMEGTDGARGVNYRTLEELFHIIEERKSTFRYQMSVSVLEVYNEQIRDLLVPIPQPGVATKRLEIRQVGEGIHHVPGLVEANVNNMNEVWEVLQTGGNARAVGSTNSNEHSSRSHCMHCVMVKGENLLNGECTRSKLWLVDLAGSERIAKTEVQGERLKETQNINRSLSALGDVISALATKSPHIPFRNSKLTHLLQDSLGGDSKTLMFVQISPNENDLSETLCSLNFASRVRGIELGPARKQVDNTELIRYKQMVDKTKQDMRCKDLQIKKMEDTIHGLDIKMKEKDLKNRNLQDKIKELEWQLLVERKQARQHVDTKIAEQQQQMTRPSGVNKNLEQINLSRPLMENNNCKPPSGPSPMDGFNHDNDPTEKENNPHLAEQPLPLPKRTGRASICTTTQRIPAATVPRRNSLIPLPSIPTEANKVPSFLPMTPIQSNDREDVDMVEAECLPEPIMPWDSPKEQKAGGGTKKLSSILRRSLQKRNQLKSPMLHHHARRGGGLNVGTEKVRVSIGGRGRMNNRLLGNARRIITKDPQQKQSHREKERGWNIGTAGRNVV